MIDERLKFRHLQCFLAVAERGSLQQAAQALAITQPAVSKTLKELEATLGTRLFERGRKGARLTPSGEAFARHAGASVSALREAVASVRPGQAGGGQVTLGVLPTVAPWLVPQLLARLEGTLPALHLRLHSGTNPQLLAQLRQGELDLVIGRFAEPAAMLGLSFEHLYADPLVLVVRPGHPLVHAHPALERLLDHTLILPMPGTAIRHAADNFLAAHGLGRPSRLLETLSVSAARNHTLASDAVWFSPQGAVTQELERGWLQRLPLATEGTQEMVGLVLRADAVLNSAQRQVVEAVHQATQPHDGENQAYGLRKRDGHGPSPRRNSLQHDPT